MSTTGENEPVEQAESTKEADLHNLSDDDYFAALPEMPPVYDARGNRLTALFSDVVDARESKARARRAAEEGNP